MIRRLFILSVLLAACLFRPTQDFGLGTRDFAYAHPVPRQVHDRTLVVRLTPEAVVVEYRLELDDWTAANDLLAHIGKEELASLNSPREVYAAFARTYGPLLAKNLIATLDGKELSFTCMKDGHQVLDHLRCAFVLRAPFAPAEGPRRFAFQDGNYLLDPGRIDLSLVAALPVALLEKTAPDEALKSKAAIDLGPGDGPRLRKATATFQVPLLSASGGRQPPAHNAGETLDPRGGPAPRSPSAPETQHNLLGLLLNTELGFWTLMLLAAGFGAVHALTPGHGKTLVAAYLVGEHGTAWHALFLGLVTTLTHTGSVLVLATILSAVPVAAFAVSLASGLLVAGLGFWLLLQRLRGGPDHIHFGSHGHHHHGEDGHTHPMPAAPVGWWGLLVLGISGGIVPCWDAIAMLGFAIAAQRLWLAVPLILSFSAGLAGVLVAVGMLVVYLKGFAESRWGSGRLFRVLPVVSAAVIFVMGLALCYHSLHPDPHEAPPVIAAGR